MSGRDSKIQETFCVSDSDLEHGGERETSPEDESSADEKLGERLATPLLQGQKGLDRAQVGISAFLIAVVGVVALSSGFTLPLQTDDYERLAEVPAMHRIATASQAWNGTTLRPFAALVLAAGWQAGSGAVAFLHLFGIATHLITSILVYLLARRLLRRETSEFLAMSAGLMFALHPAVTQSVYYVSHMGSTLGAFLTLLSIVLFLRATEDGERLRVIAWGLSLVAFGLAWASDLTVWTLPVLLIAVDAVARRDVDIRTRVLSYVPHTALLAILFVSHGVSAGAPEGSPSHFYAQAETVFDHLHTIFFPANLSLVHTPFDLANAGFPVMWLAFLVISAVLMWILPLPGLAVFWVAIAAAGPGLFGLDDSFREERVYLSLAGVACLLPWLVNQVPRPPFRTAAGVATAALIAVGGYYTSERTKTWREPLRLWNEARDQCFDCLEPSRVLGLRHVSAGIQRMAAEDSQQARANFQRAEELLRYVIDEGGETADVRVAHATSRGSLGDIDGAMQSLTEALRIDPANREALLQMGILMENRAQQSHRPRDQRLALDFYENAVRSAPMLPEESVRYASFLVRLGDLRRAEMMLQWTRDANSPAAEVLRQIQSLVQTVVGLEAGIQPLAEKDPNDPEIDRMRARQKGLLGDHQKTAYLIEELFETNGPDLGMWYLLAVSKAKVGAVRRFLDEWPDAPNAAEGVSPWLEVARRLAGSREWEGALLALEREAELFEGRPLPLLTLAGMAMKSKRVERAFAFLTRAAQENPESPEPWLKLVELRKSLGQREQAVRMLQQAEVRNADEATVEALRAELGVRATGPAAGSGRSTIRE